jgi:glycosyltransferase involved in cell wall biosynthesis
VTNPKRIIFINQNSGYLMIDIINAYSSAGYTCVLITGRIIERGTPLNPTVRIERIIKYDRTTTFRRLFTWITAFFQIWTKVITKFRSDSLFIISNPPLAPLLPLLVKNRFQLLILDVYPDVLLELGYFSEKSLILRFWRRANKKVYTKAENIYTITESMRQILMMYARNLIIKVVPVWTDNVFLRPIEPTENSFLIKHRLSGKFIVLYSGNIGLSGDVEVLIDIAEKIERDNVIFIIIGDGVKKARICEKVETLSLKNVVLLPWQPAAELPFSLSSANLAVVSLGAKVSKMAVPSKLYNYLSVGAPLLCISSKGSEVENLILKYDCGRNFEPDDVKGMIDFIIEISDNKILQRSMQINSLKASKDFSTSKVNGFLTITSHEKETQKL